LAGLIKNAHPFSKIKKKKKKKKKKKAEGMAQVI
jgi:hypothetical protein